MTLKETKARKEASKGDQCFSPKAALGELKFCPGLAGQDQVGNWILFVSAPLLFTSFVCKRPSELQGDL